MTESSERRAHTRYAVANQTVQAMAVPEGNVPITFPAQARNISQGGVAFWYEQPLPIGASCHIELPRRESEPLSKEGKVANCRRVALNVHEIGVSFDTPLDDGQFSTLAMLESA